MTSLLVTRGQEDALELAWGLVVMRGGRIEQAAPPDGHLQPAAPPPFVAGFAGTSKVVSGIVQQGQLRFGGSACPVGAWS